MMDGRERQKGEEKNTEHFLAHTANLLSQSVELKKRKDCISHRVGEKKAVLALLLHSLCKINFLPPKQDVHNTLAQPQLKSAKTPSLSQYVKIIT